MSVLGKLDIKLHWETLKKKQTDTETGWNKLKTEKLETERNRKNVLPSLGINVPVMEREQLSWGGNRLLVLCVSSYSDLKGSIFTQVTFFPPNFVWLPLTIGKTQWFKYLAAKPEVRSSIASSSAVLRWWWWWCFSLSWPDLPLSRMKLLFPTPCIILYSIRKLNIHTTLYAVFWFTCNPDMWEI